MGYIYFLPKHMWKLHIITVAATPLTNNALVLECTNTAFLECGIQISYNLSIYVFLKRHPTLVAPIFLRREGL